jgi:hypothetical protein
MAATVGTSTRPLEVDSDSDCDDSHSKRQRPTLTVPYEPTTYIGKVVVAALCEGGPEPDAQRAASLYASSNTHGQLPSTDYIAVYQILHNIMREWANCPARANPAWTTFEPMLLSAIERVQLFGRRLTNGQIISTELPAEVFLPVDGPGIFHCTYLLDRAQKLPSEVVAVMQKFEGMRDTYLIAVIHQLIAAYAKRSHPHAVSQFDALIDIMYKAADSC